LNSSSLSIIYKRQDKGSKANELEEYTWDADQARQGEVIPEQQAKEIAVEVQAVADKVNQKADAIVDKAIQEVASGNLSVTDTSASGNGNGTGNGT
jgi:uncharacterized protein YtpQ (UPF0354 family)